jgi:hypothetical protein
MWSDVHRVKYTNNSQTLWIMVQIQKHIWHHSFWIISIRLVMTTLVVISKQKYESTIYQFGIDCRKKCDIIDVWIFSALHYFHDHKESCLWILCDLQKITKNLGVYFSIHGLCIEYFCIISYN